MINQSGITQQQDSNSSSSTFPQQPVQTFNSYWLASEEGQLVVTLRTYIPAIVVPIGVAGNSFALWVLHKQNLKSPSVKHYVSSLLLVNALVLIIGCGTEWISHMTDTPPLALTSDWMCKLYQFTFSVITYSSYWLLVLLLLDRTITVCSPQYCTSFCTAFTSKLLTAFVYVGLSSISIHSMWTYEVGSHGCNIDPRQQDMYTTVWPWIAATLFSYLPITILIILLCIFPVGICQQRKHRESDGQQYLALTLVLASVFAMLSLPSIILNFIDYSRPHWLSSFQSYARWYLVMEVCQLLGSLNHALTHVICFLFMRELQPGVKQSVQQGVQATENEIMLKTENNESSSMKPEGKEAV